jgi:transmembrane protein 231
LGLIVAIAFPIAGILRMNHFQNYFIVYEQPVVKFQYKFLILAENAMDSDDNKAIMCSSFDFLNVNYGNETTDCSKIRVSEKDSNFDGIIDEINFSVDFLTFHNYGIKSAAIVFFIDARISNQCDMRVPTAVIINKNFNVGNDRKILITGKLEADQSQSLACPFFLRNVKSHFFYEKLNENQTKLDEFEMKKVQQRLEHNPMHFKFQELATDVSELSNLMTSLKIQLRITEIPIRYQKTFWQKSMDVWINFLALFIISYTIVNILLTHLFENRWIMSRRKNYVKDKEF